MLQKGFFLTDSYNRAPYWDGTVLVNLTGASAFEEDTKFFPGRYRIEVAPGLPMTDVSISITAPNFMFNASTAKQVVMSYDEVFTDYFIVRAYCGSNADYPNRIIGTNPYSGPFKVNGLNGHYINSSTHGEDVTHIFGAGGGCAYVGFGSSIIDFDYFFGGGGNCLGNGNTFYESHTSPSTIFVGGAGSCLHILPVGGTFGTDYIRAYHAAPIGGGGAYGGGADGLKSASGDSRWHTRGGNSPYGLGGTNIGENGGGVGGGSINNGAGAYFNGTEWVDVPGSVIVNNNGVIAPSSMIKITYLGPLVPGQY